MKKLTSHILPLIALALIVGALVSDLRPREEPAPLFTEVETPPAVQMARGQGMVPAKAETDPAAWFEAIRPRCTPAEVTLATDLNRPPPGVEGTGYKAACFALARSIPTARALLLSLPEETDRIRAASLVYDVGKQLAAKGYHEAAGPLMELVLEFWPNHYLALYEAGTARFAAGDFDGAQAFLGRFLDVYYGRDDLVADASRMMGDMDPR